MYCDDVKSEVTIILRLQMIVTIHVYRHHDRERTESSRDSGIENLQNQHIVVSCSVLLCAVLSCLAVSCPVLFCSPRPATRAAFLDGMFAHLLARSLLRSLAGCSLHSSDTMSVINELERLSVWRSRAFGRSHM